MKPPAQALSRPEFIALMAMMSAAVAFSIDAMLPALPQIGADLAATDPNAAQLVITSFVLGMGLGTLITGPLSDAYGRRPVLLCGAGLYAIGCGAAIFTQSLEGLLLTRVVAGLGAAGPRVCVMAIIRDRYAGRGMAQVVSFVMMVFTLVPAVAPLVGASIIALSGWRGIFAAFVLFAAIYSLWFALRQPETLAPENKRPFRLKSIAFASVEVLTNRLALRATLAQGCAFGMLFGTLSAIQPIYAQVFDRADSFPWWWALISLLAGSASILNARIVMRLGMHKIVTTVMVVEVAISLAIAALWLTHPGLDVFFVAFLIWQLSVFAMAGLCIGNLNAMALQPMGHMAGLAASVVTALATVIGVVIAAPVGLAFDGTPLPLVLGIAAAATLAWAALQGLPPEENNA